jgi:hypothetical protein
MSSSQPRRSARLAAKMTSTQPIQTVRSSNPSISTQPVQQQNPRRSARLAKKRLHTILPNVMKTILPSFKHLEQIKDPNNRAHIISNIFDDLITDPMILILQPKLRNTISGMLLRLREDVHTCPTLTHYSRMRLLDYMNRLTTTIQTIRSHPYYVT